MPKITCLIKLIGIVYLFSCSPEQAERKTTSSTSAVYWTAEDKTHLLNELKRSRDDLMAEINNLGESQWNFHESAERWSIAEVVEHLEIREAFFYRELHVLTLLPEMVDQYGHKKGKDEAFLEYAIPTDANSSKSRWYLEPQGRWCDKEKAIQAFLRVRNHIIEFIETTEKDFRRQMTPQGWRGGIEMRDLHQLMLVCVAHTDRHVKQIKKIKSHENY